jgi:N-acetylmuramoyl-L-alanine amidase
MVTFSIIRSFFSIGALIGAAVCFCEVPVIFDRQIEAQSVAPEAWKKDLKRCLVVIDAGHGGKDGGTAGHGLQEKSITLDIAKRIEKQLIERGVKVSMTRSGDEFLELEERCDIANSLGGDVFLSIHMNASLEPEPHGIETYYSSRRSLGDIVGLRKKLSLPADITFHDGRNLFLAEALHARACRATEAEDRSVRDSNFIVLMHTACPSVLVECGYLTHEEEAKKLRSAAYKDKLAQAIADGLCHYLSATQLNPQRGIVLGEPPKPTATATAADKPD